MPDTPTTPTGIRDHDDAWDVNWDGLSMNHDALREGCDGCARIAAFEAEAVAAYRDALTAAVEAVPTYNRSVGNYRAAVLAILRSEQ